MQPECWTPEICQHRKMRIRFVSPNGYIVGYPHPFSSLGRIGAL